MAIAGQARRRLRAVLTRAVDEGWLGPGPVDAHIEHALAMAEAVALVAPREPAAILDLGSGGGVPGLVVAVALAPRLVVLLDGAARRVAFLRSVLPDVGGLAVIDLAEGRAEQLAREPAYAGRFGAVTARSFGRPAVTAECASRFLALGGVLVVSEPPGTGDSRQLSDRWSEAGLDSLGFGPAQSRGGAGVRLATVEKVAETPDRFPRRVGVPAKRPLW